MVKLNTTPKANHIGVVNRIRDCHTVPRAAKKITPVGIEINSVAAMKGAVR